MPIFCAVCNIILRMDSILARHKLDAQRFDEISFVFPSERTWFLRFQLTPSTTAAHTSSSFSYFCSFAKSSSYYSYGRDRSRIHTNSSRQLATKPSSKVCIQFYIREYRDFTQQIWNGIRIKIKKQTLPPKRLTEFFTTGIPVYLIFRRSSKLSSIIQEGATETRRLVAAVRRGGIITWSAIMRQFSPKKKKRITPELQSWQTLWGPI